MNRLIAKYFWDLNDKALKKTARILKDSRHPKFALRMVALLSRCQAPGELFSLISKNEFIKGWPIVRSYWLKIVKTSDFRDWWQTIYEQILKEENASLYFPGVKVSKIAQKIGALLREKRIKTGLNQKDFALKIGMKQPDISNIEKGKKNMTLETLVLLSKALGIKKIEL